VKKAQEQGHAQLPREAFSPQLHLVERDTELATIDAVIGAATLGGDRLLVLVGASAHVNHAAVITSRGPPVGAVLS
jgi:hypothetical protein